MAVQKQKPIVGWREWVSLPDFGVAVRAKIDTGAKTSAIHVFRPHVFERDGRDFIRFTLHPRQRYKKPSVRCEAELIEQRKVTSSNGQTEERYVIKTMATIGEQTFPIELTLTRRDSLTFRMLVGRQALKRRFLVDSGRSFVQGKERPEVDTGDL
ncbi:ATP-dependent zinc protease family protein [Sphingomicrobium flavum]|uniref:ATP-dependent zinc protease family protein n=1 Tax=Sphingomicrobium flavum TaxID=1229164 RepID=UPI0021ADFCB7|nr:RimK/LysX family protein [Sphingomicrobium flavum]